MQPGGTRIFDAGRDAQKSHCTFVIRVPAPRSSGRRRTAVEILREMPDRAHHGVGREAAERAQRAELQRLAEVGDQCQVRRAIALAHAAHGRARRFRLAPCHMIASMKPRARPS